MAQRQRRLTQLGVLAVVAALGSGVVIAAVRAEGRTDVRTETNDGGAWLVRRSTGVVGHLNRAAGEVSGVVDVSDPGAQFDVEQAGTEIAVNDRSSSSISVVDGRNFQVVNRIEVAPDSHLAMTPESSVIWTTEPLRVWSLTNAQLSGLENLDAIEVTAETETAGLVAQTTDGGVWIVDPAGARMAYLPTQISPLTWMDLGDVASGATSISTIGQSAVITSAAVDGAGIVAPDGSVRAVTALPAGSVLAVPAPSGTPLTAVGPGGQVLQAVDGAAAAVQVGDAAGATPVAPIAYAGCIFAAVTSPPTFTRTCANGTDQTTLLEGSSGTALRLRLVNGWIWVNDLDTGALWVTDTKGPLDRIDDWGAELSENSNGDDDSENEGSATEKRDNPDSTDSQFEEADQIDDDGVNDPPVAHDDQARTRADQAVVVDVLDNDDDPDGDVLLVTGVSGQPVDARVTPTADRTAVQVEPAPGFIGSINFTYSISDGRGGSSEANVSVTVNAADGADNRPPEPVTDVAEARAGASAALNLLNNDADPDGDGLILQSVTSETGSAIFDPSGQVTFTPDPTSAAGSASAEYVVADTFGATATGTVRIEIRLDGSNNEPDARNDSAVTVVGKPVTLNVLTNDTDPDNDPLTVAGAPAVVVPADIDITALAVTLSPDGEFFFAPVAPGSYVFRYSIIDGSESDSAIIRVDVDPVVDNRPPIAVRDDVTISRGGTKTVYVMQNDADPDGDVIALTGWSPVAGIEIEEVQGVGFRVTAAADAASQLQFQYSVSDGRSDPVSGTVVVAVSSLPSVDQAPVARPDVVEVRPGQTTSVLVLVNDYDPEGTPLRVASVATAPNASLRVGPGAQEVYIGIDPAAITGFSFGYDVVDAGGNRSASFVQVRLVPDGQANRPPVARPDVARTRSGAAVTIPVLDNDSDPDGDAIRLESISAQPAFGVAVPNPDGTLTYTADADHSGTDRLRYVVVDAFGDRSIGDVLIGVLPRGIDNLPPTAADDAYTVVAGSDPIAFDVLTNDWDGDGDSLSITDAAGNIPIAVDAGRRNLVFTPPRSIEGAAQSSTVVYSISDGRGGTDDAQVTIDVVSSLTPLAPVAVDDVVGPLLAGQTIGVDLLVNDIDPDGARAALVGSSVDPAIGFATDGSATITAGDETSEHLYTITDASGLTATALVTVIVTDNLAPTAPVISVSTEAGKPVSIDIGAQVVDPDLDQLFFACCDGARHGTTTTTASGAGALTVDFLPDSDFAGEAGFSYTADDQHGHVVSGAVMIEVTAPTNRPPTALDAVGQVEAGTTGAVALGTFATDPDLTIGDSLTFELIGVMPGGSLAGDTISIDSAIDAGDTTLAARYRVTDRAGATAEAAVTITITPSAAPPPTAIADGTRTTQGVPVAIDVVANDIDPLGRGLVVVAAGSTDGSANAAVGADARTVTITPGPDFFGTAHLVYTVQDARNTEAGQAVGQITVEVVGLPGAPATPQATASNATATVTWGQAPSNGSPIDATEIESDQVPVQAIGVVTSYTYSGLQNGVPHRFRVRAHNEAGWGPWSEYSAPVTPDTQTGVPASPTLTFSDGAILVSWTPPANEGSAIIGYNLEIGGGASQVAQLGNLTTYNWTGLNNGTSYQFRVVAVNGAGPSEPSAWSSPEHPLREPDAPGAPVATQGDRYLDLAWSKPNDNGDPVIEYEVQPATNAGASVPATGTTMRWSNLPNGVEQSFRVRARNRDADWGAWSTYSVPVKPCGVPDAVASPSATRGDTQATVTWVLPNAQGCDIDQYQVQASGGATQAASGLTHVFTGLANGTAYTFQVRAHNSVGWGAWSPASAAVTPAGLPTGPASVVARPAAVGAVDLVWPAANPNGTALTGYQIAVNTAPARDVPVATTYRYSGLTNGGDYTFRVRACNDVGCGAWSASASATTWGEPDQVGAPSVNGGNNTISANWSAPAANGNAINAYRVELDPGGVSDNGTSRSKSWGGLKDDTTYRVRVQACNDVGCGAWSGWGSAKTDPPPVTTKIVLRKGRSAVGEQNCSSSGCAHLDVTATGFAPNTTYTLRCYGNGSEFSSHNKTTNGAGTFTDDTCYYGYPNPVYVTAGGEKSNTINW